MEITHKTRTEARSGQGKGLFLLSNRKGGYALFGDAQFTHFGGVHFLLPDEWTLFKTVDDISLDRPPTEVLNKFYMVERRSSGALESFRFFNRTLYYEVQNYHGGVTIDLDMRRVYDAASVGRVYKIYFEAGCIVVEYAKHPDAACVEEPERFFLVIRGTDHFTLLNAWEPRSYPYDASRGGIAERWVYRALRLSCEGDLRLSFTFGRDKGSAMRDAGVAWDDWGLIHNRLRGYVQSVKTTNGVGYSAAVFALENCVVTLNGSVNRTGVFAGFPWFFHLWARDELISLQGLVLAEKYALVKDILMRYVSLVGEDGRLPNMHPSSVLGSADAVGWLWKRLGDLLVYLEERKLIFEYFSDEELSGLCEACERSLLALREHHVVDGFVVNAPKETWMDTDGGTGDVRGGARIEIQALTLASLRTSQLLQRLSRRGNGRSLRAWEKSLVEAVRSRFFVDGVLADGVVGGVPDLTARPNVFIAAYAFPDLLSRKEWRAVFESLLPRLWLDWGGLSSLDKEHPLFVPRYSGGNDRSYHRGDSWYWVNNLAALVLFRTDAEAFSYSVRALSQASLDELLWGGVLGAAAEVSDADHQSSSGCFAQAWSAATLVELLAALDGAD